MAVARIASALTPPPMGTSIPRLFCFPLDTEPLSSDWLDAEGDPAFAVVFEPVDVGDGGGLATIVGTIAAGCVTPRIGVAVGMGRDVGVGTIAGVSVTPTAGVAVGSTTGVSVGVAVGTRVGCLVGFAVGLGIVSVGVEVVCVSV
ncbi:hypothetical protein EPA93_40345 [Ktedonosporobacter rubrisoli]|uniref:Uncharacterized protein n=1 Tax=Ktedonosporobacter rubrisoli TaxID=2509675 RepID=A0A4P6K333_KTERU|nr:hypothetical protein EPA93_40345 [Ktedonosporobacter rubrisoli]